MRVSLYAFTPVGHRVGAAQGPVPDNGKDSGEGSRLGWEAKGV